MDDLFTLVAAVPPTVAVLAAGFAATLVIAGIAVVLVLRSAAARRAEEAERLAAEAARFEARFDELRRQNDELKARMQTVAEIHGNGQSQIARALAERLDGLNHTIGRSLTESTRTTHENLTRLAERMAVIDRAQKTMAELTGDVIGLQKIFKDKQTRGLFGQKRMEAIVADGLPANAYSFQATLSNGRRPDCLVALPNGAGGLAIDAKFPLEAWNLIRAAEAPEQRKAAEAQFRRDVNAHVKAIAERYLIAGETQDTAFLFVPSESIFADIHEHFDDIIQSAYRQRVVIVSPSLLMLSVQVVQSILKDVRMREQAHVIQAEVGRLVEDVARLDDRVGKLQAHFRLTQRDIDEIAVSTGKIARRGERIETIELDQPPARAASAQPTLLAGE